MANVKKKGFELSSLKTDPKKELEGVWEDFGDGAKVLVARTGNPRFQKLYGALPRGIRRMIDNDTLSDEHSETILCDILSKSILLGWEGILDNGKLLEYSPEEAAKYLKKYPEFRSIIWEISNEFQRFHDSSVEADIKN